MHWKQAGIREEEKNAVKSEGKGFKNKCMHKGAPPGLLYSPKII